VTKKRKKITIVGAGNVGATAALLISQSGSADIVLIDIYRNIAQAKSLDIQDALAVFKKDCSITGTDDYAESKDSDIVVITAGVPRKPGMKREELVAINSSIVRSTVEKVKSTSPRSILIIVTNPLDVMTYLAYKTSGFNPRRVIGMAGALDSARMERQISNELGVPVTSIESLIIGSHGDEMVPIFSRTKVRSKPLSGSLKIPAADAQAKLAGISLATKKRGAQIVNLLGSGSAYYAPAASIARMVNAIIHDTGETLAASVYLDGEYGLRDICIGVPVVLGASGVRSILTIELSDDERGAFLKASDVIRKTIELL